jgi:protease-4
MLILSCCACLFLFIYAAGGASSDNNIILETIEDNGSENTIAVIDINGVIAANTDDLGSGDPDMVEMILFKLEKADKDPNVKAIILRLNTPGGTVYDSDKIAKEIKRIDQNKPVIALMESSATSGGYYISATTSKIVASETTVTGSIGVIVQVIELDGLYEKLGVKVITITNTEGDVKSMENLDDPNSEDRSVMEEILDDDYEEFVKVIAEGRGMDRAEVINLADGSIYSGTKAKELGLVDELGGFDKAVELAENEAGISDANIELYDTYIDPWSDFQLFMMERINPISSVTNKFSKEPGTYAYYLPE